MNSKKQTAERQRLIELLAGLYAQEIAQQPEHGYLREHALPAFVEAQVRTFGWYRPHVPDSGRVLDWGANHGPDSCLLRASFGDSLELHACDMGEPGRFPVFQAAAGVEYRRLAHHVELPYPDSSFSAVIGSGVLEHTVMDDESLKELYRVTNMGGVLVISYLPNRFSWEEWRRRVIDKRDYHDRLYSLRDASQLLKRRGFRPIVAAHQSFFWERALPDHGTLAACMRLLMPFHLFGPTLFLVAQKVPSM